MSQRKLSIHLLFSFTFLLIVTLTNQWFSLNYWPFWLGGILGMIIPFVDSLFYVYFLRPRELTSQRVKYLISKKQYKEASILIKDTRTERSLMVIHSFMFEIILLILIILIITSSASLWGIGLSMGIFLHLLIDQLSDYLGTRNLDTWYMNLDGFLIRSEAKKYMIIGFVVFVILSLII